MRKRRIDAVAPVGIKKKRRGTAVGQREVVPGSPLTVGHHLVEPGVGGFQHAPCCGQTVAVALALGADAVEYDLLLWGGNVVVEETIHMAHLQSGARIRG